jgi:hypothetical protein
MELLPGRIADPALLQLLGRLLAVDDGAVDAAALRRRLLGEPGLLQSLVALADAQGVLVPLIWSARRRHLLPPEPAAGRVPADHPMRQLSLRYRGHLERRQRQQGQLADLIGALNRQGIAPLLLKGARFLVDDRHPWAEARTMRDFDPLVAPAEAARAVAALEAIGYVSAPPEPLHHHLPTLWLAEAPSAVELHLDALAAAAQPLLGTAELWARAIPRQDAFGRYSILPDGWQLLVAMLHHQVSDRGHARHILALKPLWEFAWLAAGLGAEQWAEIAQHLRARGGLDLLGDWVAQAAGLYGLPVRDGAVVSPAAAAAARRTLAHAGAPGWLRRTRFLADQLATGFSRPTMARRYEVTESEVSLRLYARHLGFLIRRYRGQMAKRLLDRGRRPS